MKAIETSYKGYRFRSRLEARWAYCLDLLNWKWEYEPEGYDLGDAGFYLPDFLLRKDGDGEGYKDGDPMLWIEVKPKHPTKDEKHKLSKLVEQTGTPGVFAVGLPEPYALQVGLDGYHEPIEENPLSDLFPESSVIETIAAPVREQGCFTTTASIGSYSRWKWGRPGWFMGEGYLEDDNDDHYICEAVKAIRFEHKENKRTIFTKQNPTNVRF